MSGQYILTRNEEENIAMSFYHEARRAEVIKLHCIIVLGEAVAQRSTAHHEGQSNYMNNVVADYFPKESKHTFGAQQTTAFMQHSLRSRFLHL